MLDMKIYEFYFKHKNNHFKYLIIIRIMQKGLESIRHLHKEMQYSRVYVRGQLRLEGAYDDPATVYRGLPTLSNEVRTATILSCDSFLLRLFCERLCTETTPTHKNLWSSEYGPLAVHR